MQVKALKMTEKKQQYPHDIKSLCLYTAISRKVSEKVMQQSQKVDGFEFAVLLGNLKEWHERPWTYMYVCRC